MARVAISITQMKGPYNPISVNPITMTSSDSSNNHYWSTPSLGDILVMHNEGTGSVVATIKAVADSQGRTVDDAITISAGVGRAFGPLEELLPWVQSDGTIYVDVDTSTDLKMTVLRRP